MKNKYQIGTPGKPWEAQEKNQWLKIQTIKRSYKEEVISKLSQIDKELFIIEKYGELEYKNFNKYELNAIKSRKWDSNKKTILVTGGVHGYETSGVQGALEFIVNKAKKYTSKFNIIVIPCVCPWGYETINRWTPTTNDPNRSFLGSDVCDEANLVIRYLLKDINSIHAHFDLHETTNSDMSEFRPAKEAKDGTIMFEGDIPDGFYIIGDETNPQKEFYKNIIENIEKITHIAPSNEKKELIGLKTYLRGVVLLDIKKYGVCNAITNAKYKITTEVYPDSKKTNPKDCILAQVQTIESGLNYILKNI